MGAFFERDLARLFDGPVEKPSVVRTVARPDREWAVPIAFVNRVINGGENILEGWVEIENKDGALLPGMNGTITATLASPEEKVIAAPLKSILQVGNRHYVFVQQGKEFKRVKVELGRRDAHYVEVLKGLYPGDQVVVPGVNEMNNAHSAVR